MMAEMLGRFAKGKIVDQRPKVELITTRAACEAMEDSTIQIGRELAARGRLASRQRTAAAELIATTSPAVERTGPPLPPCVVWASYTTAWLVTWPMIPRLAKGAT